MSDKGKKRIQIAGCLILLGILILVLHKLEVLDRIANPDPFQKDDGLEEIVKMDTAHYTYEQMEEDIGALKKRYGRYLKVEVPKKSVDGRKLYVLSVGNKNAKHHILIQATMHAREYINSLIAMKQTEMLLRGCNVQVCHGWDYQELLEEVCFHIIPMDNPDGVTISQFGPEAVQSKKLRNLLQECYDYDVETGDGLSSEEEYWMRWKANAGGVDLNKNFDSGWSTFEDKKQPASARYKGEKPESEPEVQVILEQAEKYDVESVISYHSQGGVVFWDFGSEGEVHENSAELAGMTANLLQYALDAADSQDGAGCSDYYVLEKGIPAITIENGIGFGECPLPDEAVEQVWERNQNLLPELAFYYSGLEEKTNEKES